MRNNFKYLMLIFLIGVTITARSQSTLSTTIRPISGTNVLGWTGGSFGTLEIRNDFSSDINFFTSTVARMQIRSNGNIGIGNFTTFSPRNDLHQHAANNSGVPGNGYHQFTNTNTGAATSVTGFQVGLEYDAVRNLSDGVFKHFQDGSRFIFSSMDATGQMHTRMNIQKQTVGGQEVTRVKIIEDETHFPNSGYLTSPPCALLHLGHDWPPLAGGHRSWMDIGTYTNAQSDMMYVGMKNNLFDGTLWSDRMNAVIAWGDNIAGTEGADDLQVIFSASQFPFGGEAESQDGLEVMRFTPRGHIGIGNYSPVLHGDGSGIRPHRRLEIYDEHDLLINSITHLAAAPQLRLTYTPDGNVLNGIWTDFQTTSIGDLYIHPYGVVSSTDATQINRNVGINTSTPANTLEINSNDASATTTVGGGSGLRFTDLTTASTPLTTNPFGANNPCMLTVNATGDVVLVKDAGLTKADNGLIVNPSQNVQLGQIVATSGNPAKFIRNSEIPLNGFSLVFTDNVAVKSNTSSIGIGTFTPNAKLHIYRPVNDITARVSDPVALRVETVDISTNNSYVGSCYGVYSLNTGANRLNYGGYFIANSANGNVGVAGRCTTAVVSGSVNSTNIGGEFEGSNGGGNIGIRASANFGTSTCGGYFEANSGSSSNVGVSGSAGGTPPTLSPGYNVGGRFHADAATNNYAVYASTSTTCTATSSTSCANVAGYFDGCVVTTSGSYTSSDVHLKNNIEPLNDALQIINLLSPKKY